MNLVYHADDETLELILKLKKHGIRVNFDEMIFLSNVRPFLEKIYCKKILPYLLSLFLITLISIIILI
jgi:hypothetical protein